MLALRSMWLSHRPVVVALFAFLVVTIAAGIGVTMTLDRLATPLVQRYSARWLDWASGVASLAGAIEVTGPLVALCVVLRWGEHTPGRAAGALALFALGALVEIALKHWLAHAPVSPALQRPSLFDLPIVQFDASNSYPSGHVLRWSFLSTLVAGPTPRRTVVVGALATSALMAATRVYLGAHWLSDVVGGALLGWALARVALDCFSVNQHTPVTSKERGERAS